MLMTQDFEALPGDVEKDIERNRLGRLSKRQWLELTTEPLVTLLLLSTPVILLLGSRASFAGRWLILGMLAVLGVTMLIRATRFARVKLHYHVLYAEQPFPRWQFWRKISLTTKSGDTIRFDRQISSPLGINQEEPYLVYFIEIAGSKTLVSLAPQRHPKVDKWQPSSEFAMRGGVRHTS